jgi:hypothetical protein
MKKSYRAYSKDSNEILFSISLESDNDNKISVMFFDSSVKQIIEKKLEGKCFVDQKDNTVTPISLLTLREICEIIGENSYQCFTYDYTYGFLDQMTPGII